MMRWFRANLQIGARLAMFALTLQVALSFAHIHLNTFAHATPGLTSSTQPDPSAPTQPGGDADNYCSICAAMHITANSFLPKVPVLPIPFVSQPVGHSNPAAAVFIARRHASFQSRAPPPATPRLRHTFDRHRRGQRLRLRRRNNSLPGQLP